VQALTLQATESWYRGIVEVAPEALLVLDRSQGVILANQESEAIFGYAPGQLKGVPYQALVPQALLAAFDALVAHLRVSHTQHTAEGFAVRADGSEFPIEMRLCILPAHLERGECLCAAIRDLSQRKADERRLREAHEQQQAIVTAAPYGIAVVLGGVMVQTNPRLDELLGYAPGEQLQHSPQIWLGQAIDADFIQILDAEVRAILAKGDTYQTQRQLYRKDGSHFWASISARIIPSEDISRGSIWVVEDISAQHAAAIEMQQARQLAEVSAQTKADFLANMSHEIRTPMNAIIGMTHLTLCTTLDERQRDYLSKVQSSSRHLLGVLDDILDFSKMEAGKLQLDVCDFSLSKLLEEVVDQVRPRLAVKHLDLLFDVASGVPEQLRGDPLRLRQILLNYLGNAVKFTERGCQPARGQ
jgi:PAS domain S-box-containing protein